MNESHETPSSRTALSAVLIAIATLVVVVGIVAPPYLRARNEQRRIDEFTAQAQPVLDALIEAERAYKERTGKFWRDRSDTLSAEATKQALNVDVANTPGCRFAVYPPDLAADPTLRVAAKGAGQWEGIAIECAYDAIEKKKNCHPA
jgi:type II secretory pathway pseudopilin PulG